MERREKTDKEAESLFKELMAENYQSLGKEIDIHVQEVSRLPNRINPKKTTPRHTAINRARIKDKLLFLFSRSVVSDSL